MLPGRQLHAARQCLVTPVAAALLATVRLLYCPVVSCLVLSCPGLSWPVVSRLEMGPGRTTAAWGYQNWLLPGTVEEPGRQTQYDVSTEGCQQVMAWCKVGGNTVSNRSDAPVYGFSWFLNATMIGHSLVAVKHCARAISKQSSRALAD